MSKKTSCKDHKGKTYPTIAQMCEVYGVSPTLYLKRIERGWSVQAALEGRKSEPMFFRDGVDYYTQKEICDAFSLNRNTFREKLKNGYTIDEIIDGITHDTQDHLGKYYKNEADMCAAYGVKVSTFRARKRKGMSLEEALTTKRVKKRANK